LRGIYQPIDGGGAAQYAKRPMRSLAFALAFSLAACKAPDLNDPQTWIKELADSEPKARIKAVQELRRLKAKSAAPQIAALLKDPLVKEDAALGLQDLGGSGEVQPLLDAVDTTVGAGSDQATRVANRTNAKIAEALGNIGDPRAGPALQRLARASDEWVRLSAVQALGRVHDASAVPELSRIVDDPASPPILIKKAIVSLGEIGDAAAIPALEHGLLLERQGVSFLPESSFALFLLGPQAVEPLLKIAQDQDAAFLAWAKENNRAAAGTYAKAALVLGDLEDPRATPVLLAKLKYQDPDPVPGTSRLLTNLVRMFAANALGRMRVKEAAAPIAALIATRDAQDEGLVAFASEALVWIGDRAQAKDLLRKSQSGALALRLAVAQAAGLLGDAALAKDLTALAQREAKGGASLCAKQLAEAGLPEGDPKAACESIAALFRDRAAPLDAAHDCADAACWLKKLDDQRPLVRARAAYELGHAGAAESAPALLKLLANDDLVARAAAIRAVDWLAAVPAAKGALKAGAAAVAAQLAAEQGKSQYFKVDEDLRRLSVKLARL
jgi:HEAT repeat protein